MWKCKACGEKSDQIFLDCWNCNMARNTPCDVGQLIQWGDSDLDRAGIHSESFDIPKRNRVLVRTAAAPVYRFAKLLSRLAIAIKVFTLGFMVCGFAITLICCSSRKLEIISCVLILVATSIVAFIAVRVSSQSFILKMTIHLLLHVAPDLRNECTTIYDKTRKT
jgi:hypothetical protein